MHVINNVARQLCLVRGSQFLPPGFYYFPFSGSFNFCLWAGCFTLVLMGVPSIWDATCCTLMLDEDEDGERARGARQINRRDQFRDSLGC